MNDKASITFFLIQQAEDCLVQASNIGKKRRVKHEVQLSINIDLLLGISLEGIINEIGEHLIDSWTWKKLEMVQTTLKWRIISGFDKGFSPSGQTMDTISKLQKTRNDIAHPKSKKVDTDIIIESEDGRIMYDPKKDSPLPPKEVRVYIGYQKLLEQYNFDNSKKNMILTLNAIKLIKEHLDLSEYSWIEDTIKFVDKIIIPPREFLERK
jgi:hypothetical protein